MLTREEYEARRQARYERLLAAAQNAERESQSLSRQADQMASIIPFGQPILVGHYTEHRDRRYRERIHNKMRRGYDLHLRAEHLRERAQAVERNNAIFSDDPNAVEKIEDKIARLEEQQAVMRAANKLVRKGDRDGLLDMGFTETQVTKLFKPDFCGRLGFPDYQLTNNNANIRRLKQRAVEVQKRQAQADVIKEVRGIKIEISPSENRVRLFFKGKPPETTRTKLKSRGFRWAPSQGCWSAYYNSSSLWAVQDIEKGEIE